MVCPACGLSAEVIVTPHFYAGRWCEGAEAPGPEAPPEAPPERPAPPGESAYGRRVTEADVTEALAALGDETLSAYRAGDLSILEAYRLAQSRMKTSAELRGRRRGGSLRGR
jgi:hypothetical protein